MSECSRVIGYNGQQEVTLLDAIRTQLGVLNLLYFDYFVNAPEPTIEDFTDMCVTSVKNMCFALDCRYADHVEGLRNKLTNQKEKDAQI